eukprot:1148973-Pelagomonas_calceolata.AAC.3
MALLRQCVSFPFIDVGRISSAYIRVGAWLQLGLCLLAGCLIASYDDGETLLFLKAVTLHTVLLVVGGTCHAGHTLIQLKQLGPDRQRALKVACKLHALCSVCPQAVTTRRHHVVLPQLIIDSYAVFTKPALQELC